MGVSNQIHCPAFVVQIPPYMTVEQLRIVQEKELKKISIIVVFREIKRKSSFGSVTLPN